MVLGRMEIMSVGTGIFLAAVILSAVYLYGITRDRWRWGKIIRRGVVGVGCAAVLVGVGVAAVTGYGWIAARPKPQTEYAEIRLGMSMADVKYARGYPSFVAEGPKPASEADKKLGMKWEKYQLLIPVEEL